jgi:hypothetical protein
VSDSVLSTVIRKNENTFEIDLSFVGLLYIITKILVGVCVKFFINFVCTYRNFATVHLWLPAYRKGRATFSSWWYGLCAIGCSSLWHYSLLQNPCYLAHIEIWKSVIEKVQMFITVGYNFHTHSLMAARKLCTWSRRFPFVDPVDSSMFITAGYRTLSWSK